MNGLHLIADLHDCRCAPGLLLDAAGLEVICVDTCTRHGLTVVGRLFHAFRDAAGQPAGVTGTVVLAESHLAVHTWPEVGGVTLDVHVCNFSGDNSARAQALFSEMIATFAPTRLEKEVARGHLAPVSGA
ncbi:MAG: S-adenosylmethionine decarboxylase [Dechloromonas sp.]|nr:MAG: S-adenosylmethionine decarboxylase [Dechloromonas sp.]